MSIFQNTPYHSSKINVVLLLYFLDLSSLQRQSEEGANMGFTGNINMTALLEILSCVASGKQVIHPSQVDVVQKAFMPSQDQITWATGLIEAFHEHQQLGKVWSHRIHIILYSNSYQYIINT